MKYLLVGGLLLLGPQRLWAQANVSPLPTTAPDTAYWNVSLEAEQRTYYLGREYGSHAISLLPSVLYSHPSGFYGSVSGYYFSQSEAPRYTFTDVELGYANKFTDAWTYSLSVDRLFFSKKLSADEPKINNGLEAYTNYALGPLNLGLDYNFFFQQNKAQTVSLALGGTLRKKAWLGFDDVSLLPGFELFWGSPLALLRYGGVYSVAAATATTTSRRQLRNAGSTAEGGSTRPRLMGYEFTLPLEINRYPFSYAVTGHYVVPVRQSGETEPLPPAAYVSLKVDFTFR